MSVECAFGIASSNFRILLKAIETKVKNADHVVKAICILHNVIIDIEKDKSRNQEIINTFHESNTNSNNNQLMRINTRHRSNNRAYRTAIQIRNNFVQYFQENKILVLQGIVLKFLIMLYIIVVIGIDHNKNQ